MATLYQVVFIRNAFLMPCHMFLPYDPLKCSPAKCAPDGICMQMSYHIVWELIYNGDHNRKQGIMIVNTSIYRCLRFFKNQMEHKNWRAQLRHILMKGEWGILCILSTNTWEYRVYHLYPWFFLHPIIREFSKSNI